MSALLIPLVLCLVTRLWSGFGLAAVFPAKAVFLEVNICWVAEVWVDFVLAMTLAATYTSASSFIGGSRCRA
ncbi:hypothetical protein P4S72_11335 [Vibrio sp. PP-XX7]